MTARPSGDWNSKYRESPLGPSARQAIDLRYSVSLKRSEVGDRLKRSEGAVKLLVHRARAALKHCLDRKIKPQ